MNGRLSGLKQGLICNYRRLFPARSCEGLPHITERELLASDFTVTSARAKAWINEWLIHFPRGASQCQARNSRGMSFHILGNTFAKLMRTLAGLDAIDLVIRTVSDALQEVA